jgi:micrococcal nuclease
MRWRRAVPWLLLAVFAVLYATGGHEGGRSRDAAGLGGVERAGAQLSGRVVKITDGDTIHVAVGGRDVKVRLIGIDTPEVHKPGTPVQCFGRRATARNAQLIAGRDVLLRLDAETRDRYGRLLAYVYRRPDGLFVNAVLVNEGYARTLTIPPNVRFAGRFARLAQDARRAGRGLWSACPRNL